MGGLLLSLPIRGSQPGDPPPQCPLSLLLSKVPLRMHHLQGHCWMRTVRKNENWSCWHHCVAQPLYLRKMIQRDSLCKGNRLSLIAGGFPSGPAGQPHPGCLRCQAGNSCFLSCRARLYQRGGHLYFLTVKVNIKIIKEVITTHIRKLANTASITKSRGGEHMFLLNNCLTYLNNTFSPYVLGC